MLLSAVCCIAGLMVSTASSADVKPQDTLWKQRTLDAPQKVQSARWTVPTRSPLSCARECGQRGDDCLEFSYDEGQGLCHLDPVLTPGFNGGDVHFERTGIVLGTGQSPISVPGKGYVLMPDGKSWVKGVEAALTWQDAKGACEEDGAHLVRLQTQAKRDDLKEIVDQTAIQHNEFWVDANDIATEGVFQWGDGSPVDSVLFADGEPDTSYNAEEDCVLAEIGVMLADRFCDSHHYYVCEL